MFGEGDSGYFVLFVFIWIVVLGEVIIREVVCSGVDL